MKKALFVLGIALMSVAGASAQVPPAEVNQSKAEITFEKDVHDYGQVKQGGNGECEFKFTNTGSEPLIISMARGSCGCTVPDWPKQPIKPGETGKIKVKYDTNRPGPINKSVTISSNAKTSPTTILRITGNVEAAPTNTTPVNTPSAGAPVEK